MLSSSPRAPQPAHSAFAFPSNEHVELAPSFPLSSPRYTPSHGVLSPVRHLKSLFYHLVPTWDNMRYVYFEGGRTERRFLVAEGNRTPTRVLRSTEDAN